MIDVNYNVGSCFEGVEIGKRCREDGKYRGIERFKGELGV